MKNVFLVIVFFLSFNFVEAQMNLISGNPLVDLPNIFNQKEVTVEIMDEVGINPLYNEYAEKLKTSIQENYEWFLEYSKKIQPGKPLDYHSNFGISKDEYIEFLGITGEIEILSSGNEKLKIIKNNSVIQFNGINKLKELSHVKTDLENNQVLYKGYILPFEKNIYIDDSSNGFKSEWKGYSWSFENQNAPEEYDLSNIESLDIKIVTLTIGQLNKNGKIYMKFEERIMKNGVKTIDVQIPIVF